MNIEVSQHTKSGKQLCGIPKVPNHAAHSGFLEVISLPSPPYVAGELYTQSVMCSGGARLPLASVLLTCTVDRGWRRELRFRG